LWSGHRQVRKDATVKLFGGIYETGPALAGRTVECAFDPFDLARIEVRCRGKPDGLAVPRQIGRHAHPKARPEQPITQPPAATGVGYLGILAAEHDAAQRRRINHGALAGDGGQLPGQTTIDEALAGGEES
jgi:putative transposase